MPRARPASSAAPAEAASPDRWRTAGMPRMDVSTSTHSGSPVPAPPSVTPCAVLPPRRPAVTTSMQRRTSQATDSITARDRSSMPCAAPRPTKPARASSRHQGARAPSSQRHGRDAARAGRALRRPGRQLVDGPVEQPAQPGQEGTGGREAALEQPPFIGPTGDHGPGRRGDRSLVHRDRHVGRRAPADHGALFGGTRAQHLALTVPGADDDGSARSQSELGARYRLEMADNRVGRHDAGELAQRRTGQLAHGIAVEVVEPAPRGERDVGDHLVGHAPEHEVAGREDDVAGRQPGRLVRGQPGQLGRHGAGVERDPGPGPVDVLAPERLGEDRCLGHATPVGPQDPLADGVTRGAHRHEGLPRS